ncbi:conserved oligomeric Golgi complex subunit 5 [Iris pallida]|uniref:Conserved oligomeric Golgi complex subunit 5 n=1 Tax=Iris pallida TaxID=29817 RepID=A0AAX6GDV1_IRIPA|nr:conserved oligomeric Golgi complex subunit 5 [Iris pallida]
MSLVDYHELINILFYMCNSTLVLWLDSCGEDQVWKGIKVTLDDYELKVRAQGDKEFSPVYPFMLQIGSSLAEVTSSQ